MLRRPPQVGLQQRMDRAFEAKAENGILPTLLVDTQAGVEQLVLGLYMIRGDNMCALEGRGCSGAAAGPCLHVHALQTICWLDGIHSACTA